MSQPAAPTSPQPSFGIADIMHLVTHDLPDIQVTEDNGLAGLHQWLAAIQDKKTPTIQHPRIALFLASYQEDGGDIEPMLQEIRNPKHPLSVLAGLSNADFQVHELGYASSDDEMLHAVAYGMMAPVPGIDLLILSPLNAAHAAKAQQLIDALTSGTSPIETLLASKCMDIAAVFGAMIAARLARMPVLADSIGAEAAALVIETLAAGKANHVRKARDLSPLAQDLPDGAAGAFMIPILKNIAALAV